MKRPASPKRTGPHDLVIGANVRLHRIAARVSQTTLGKRLGVTFQQIQKYENGTNRIGAGRLFAIATALNVPVMALYDKLKTVAPNTSPTLLLNRRDAYELAEAFSKITNPRIRRSLVALAQIVAKSTRD